MRPLTSIATRAVAPYEVRRVGILGAGQIGANWGVEFMKSGMEVSN